MDSQDDKWYNLDFFEKELKADIYKLLQEAQVKTITANIVNKLKDFINVDSLMMWMAEYKEPLGFESVITDNILSVIKRKKNSSIDFQVQLRKRPRITYTYKTIISRVYDFVTKKRIFTTDKKTELNIEIVKEVFNDRKEILQMLKDNNGAILQIDINCVKYEIARVTDFINEIFNFSPEMMTKCEFNSLFEHAIDHTPQISYSSEYMLLADLSEYFLRHVMLYKKLAEYKRLTLTFDDLILSSQSSSASLDYQLFDNYGRIFERGVLKKQFTQELFSRAKTELAFKCFELDPLKYDSINVIFGFVLCGPIYHLFLIDFNRIREKDCESDCMNGKRRERSEDCLIPIRQYDLLDVVDRVLLVWHKMIITEICQHMS